MTFNLPISFLIFCKSPSYFSVNEMKLKLVFQMWSQKWKQGNTGWSHGSSLLLIGLGWFWFLSFFGFFLYTLVWCCFRFHPAFLSSRLVPPLEQLCPGSHHLSRTQSHLARRAAISSFQPAFALLHSSGVCMSEFMLILAIHDNNQLPSLFPKWLVSFLLLK